MPITNFLNLADIYRAQDQMRANEQQATLRNLQIQDAQRQERDRQSLEEISRMPGSINPDGTLNYGGMSREAIKRGMHEQGGKWASREYEQRTHKAEYKKRDLELQGQFAVIPEAPKEQREQLYQSMLTALEEHNPEKARQLREMHPNWSDKLNPVVKQMEDMSMTPYQRRTLQAAKDKALAKLMKGDDLKASDANSMRASLLSKLKIPFTTDPLGNITITSLDAEQDKKLTLMEMRMSELHKQGYNILEAPNIAYQDVLSGRYTGPGSMQSGGQNPGATPGTPSPGNEPPPKGGFKPIPPDTLDAAKRAWADPNKRERLRKQFAERGYDISAVAGTGPSKPGVELPAATVQPRKLNVYKGSFIDRTMKDIGSNMTGPNEYDDPFDPQ